MPPILQLHEHLLLGRVPTQPIIQALASTERAHEESFGDFVGQYARKIPLNHHISELQGNLSPKPEIWDICPSLKPILGVRRTVCYRVQWNVKIVNCAERQIWQ